MPGVVPIAGRITFLTARPGQDFARDGEPDGEQGQGLSNQHAKKDPNAGRQVSDKRRRLVAGAVEDWVRQLIDLTGRNQLLYYRTLKRGTMELNKANRATLNRLLAGESVSLAGLFPNTDAEPDRFHESLRRARVIHAKSREHFEERGINTLFMTAGMARWETSTTSSTPCAPVLLRPVVIKPRGASSPDFDLRLDGEWSVNQTLLHLVRSEFDVSIDGEALERDIEPDVDQEGLDSVFLQLFGLASKVPGFDIEDRSVVGTFAYTKLPMVRDLQESVGALADNDLIAAIAGDKDARAAVRVYREDDAAALHPDWIPPADEFLILDTDSSQNAAINGALAGRQLVIQGPPGTGKSQTIANLIASLAARGRRVLFVAEKRAAIEAVTKRLEQNGLGHLVMDLHGGAGSRRQIAERIGESFQAARAATPVDVEKLHVDLATARSTLVDHDRALHERRDPWELSLFDIYGKLAALPKGLPEAMRLPTAPLATWDEGHVDEIARDIETWASLSRRIIDRSSPWAGASVASNSEADAAFSFMLDAAESTGPELSTLLEKILAATGLRPELTMEQWEDVLGLLEEIGGLLEEAHEGIYRLPMDATLEQLAPESLSAWAAVLALLTDGQYRTARRTVRELLHNPKRFRRGGLHQLVSEARDHRRRWERAGGAGPPQQPDGVEEARALHRRLRERLDALAPSELRTTLLESTPAELVVRARALAEDESQLRLLPQADGLERLLSDLGLSPLVDVARERKVPADHLPGLLRKSWLVAVEREIRHEDPRVGGFDGPRQLKTLSNFRDSDANHLKTTAQRVSRAVAENAVSARNKHPDQDTLLAAQSKKKRGHLSMRELFQQAPDVLTSLRPCWAMSPLVVAQLLPAAPVFDVVIFDEASQVRPADAIPALLRASQAVIAGDDKQLPPTSSFVGRNDEEDVEEEEDEEEDAGERALGLTTGFESILDVLDPVLGGSDEQVLTWHYRSRDDRLIAFANQNTYHGMLTTFPGTQVEPPIEHVLVPFVSGRAVDTRSSAEEVERVVQLALEHAEHRPDESLGIIAMGQYHASRIEAALSQRLRDSPTPAVLAFFDETRDERTFIKNIERVQGDERDAIILSIGYAKGADGRLRYRFGTLNEDGGERRLNVAVTRQRRRLTVVSSFSHLDMDPGRSTRRGVVLLRSFLKYSESRGRELENEGAIHPMNPFEVSIFERLVDAGLDVIPQYGTSGFRIDFAVPHPAQDGRMLMAIEADGAMYHSATSARDRDRLRQQILEAQGWIIHRIWSTDWFNDPHAEVAKVREAYEHALQRADRSADKARSKPTATTDAAATQTLPTPQPAPVRTATKPRIIPGASITEYRQAHLVTLFLWIASDGIIRTHEEQIQEAIAALGFRRRGSRIIEALEKAIRAAGT